MEYVMEHFPKLGPPGLDTRPKPGSQAWVLDPIWDPREWPLGPKLGPQGLGPEPKPGRQGLGSGSKLGSQGLGPKPDQGLGCGPSPQDLVQIT